ncbi:carbohydrate-binding protein [Streptomyces sp. ERV7]|uniref:CBM35 domain-containing protein n=1 Tax=Streptomyces sp. ERV7 TaxID=1322334 RepID=UPI0007F481B0|nr:CBM35 domain-containing protein [Streptomyces sp. ERV7]OAR26300.1 carbohydrate-binding protein [Streptomyces sp. ERV7]
MTPGNNGASTPEDDDPFGYLYEDGQASGATPPRSGGYGYGYPGPTTPQQPGVPRTSYNQVRTVGERQYGQVPQQQYGQGPQQPYGQPPQQQYGQPTAQYAAPETYGGGPNRPAPPVDGGGGRGSRGPNTKGLLIGAVAVVAAVVIGIGVALLSNSDGKKDDDAGKPAGGGTSQGTSQQPSNKPSDSTSPAAQELPKQDAATLKLGGGAVLAKDVKGAQGTDGAYVNGFNQIGASLTWQADLPSPGSYYLYVRFAIPAKDANATVTVNGKPNSQPIGLKNFRGSTDPNLENNWQYTWAPVTLKQGQNTIKFSCEQGNQCDAVFDWVEISKTKKQY